VKRVIVTDDSSFMRGILTSALTGAGFDVVGAACDGDEALALCAEHRPDAMTLDLHMPNLDGLGVLRGLRSLGGPEIPVVVVSAFSPAHGARAVDALSEGAFDLVQKPDASSSDALGAFLDILVAKVTLASARNGSHVRLAAASPAPRPAAIRSNGAAPRPRSTGSARAVMIACSTGGPRALATLLPKLPRPLGVGTVIVQHMPPGFTNSLAARLDRSAKLDVSEAAGGEKLDPARALIAPGGKHLRLGLDRRTRLTEDDEVGGLRPRADLTIADMARHLGERMLLVVLTGMGADGLEGAREVKRRGGRILAEHESSCTVYGMPRAVVEAKLADEVLVLDELPDAIAAEAGS
jgi:two-component system chemotaxis response regulator CheB